MCSILSFLRLIDHKWNLFVRFDIRSHNIHKIIPRRTTRRHKTNEIELRQQCCCCCNPFGRFFVLPIKILLFVCACNISHINVLAEIINKSYFHRRLGVFVVCHRFLRLKPDARVPNFSKWKYTFERMWHRVHDSCTMKYVDLFQMKLAKSKQVTLELEQFQGILHEC